MAEVTELTISNLKVHGSGVASCGSYPDIKISATIKFTRENQNDTTVNWEVSSISWSHPTSGKFGFKFRIYLYFYNTSTRYDLVMKDNTTASYWWNATSLKKPSGSFTADENTPTITVAIQAHGGSGSCTSGSDSHFCYGSSTYRNLKTYTVTMPTYAPYYRISYNNNGGEGTIETQIKEPEQDITLTTDIPSYPVTITYHDNPDRVETVERPFLYWLGNGTQYDPGDLYTIDANCEMVAQWDAATFTPVLPTKYVRITYVLNGGTLEPAYTDIARPSLGYDPDPNVTVNPMYPNAVQGTTTLKILGLYPVYGDAVMPFANLPVPTKRSYRFDGWYYDAELQNPVVGNISTATDITLYAGWTYLRVHIVDDNQEWQGDGQYIWRFNGTSWEKVAHLYAFDGTSWVDQSGG